MARFAGLDSAPSLSGKVVGLELVGGIGVHKGLKFREDLPEGMAIETLMPDSSWHEAGKWKLSRLLWRRLSVLDPDVVLVPGYYTLPAIASALWARLHGRASVLMTESTAYDHERIAWKELLKSIVLRTLFDWAVAGGKAHVAYLEQLGFPADRVVGSYDVVNNDFFEQGTESLRRRSPQEFGLPSPYFLYVGRLSEEKNVAGLLASWIEYPQSGRHMAARAGRRWPRSRCSAAAGGELSFRARHNFRGPQELPRIAPVLRFRRLLCSSEHTRALGPGGE